jgi:small subunit ribosomal protein S4
LINGRKVNIPSYLVKVGDVIELGEKSRTNPRIADALEGVARRGIPSWLELDRENFRGRILALPQREDITMPIKEQLIVEFYSK